MVNIIIDTDVGADDLLAISLLQKHPKIKISAILASYGIYQVEDAAQRLLTFFSQTHVDSPPILQGAHKPLVQSFSPMYSIHGKYLLKTTTKYGFWKQLTAHFQQRNFFSQLPTTTPIDAYLAIGPLTNLAHFSQTKEFTRVKKIIIMGGSLLYPGNANVFSDANLYIDPDASKIVLQSKTPITLIPLNITDQIQIDSNRLNRVTNNQLWKQVFRDYIKYYQNIKKSVQSNISDDKHIFSGAAIHDVVAAAGVINESIFEYEKIKISLEYLTHPNTRGMIVPLLRGEHRTLTNSVVTLNVATKINQKKFWELFDEVMN